MKPCGRFKGAARVLLVLIILPAVEIRTRGPLHNKRGQQAADAFRVNRSAPRHELGHELGAAEEAVAMARGRGRGPLHGHG